MPPGPVKVTVTVESDPVTKISTLGDLLDSGVLGLWADRDDLPRANKEFTEWRRGLWNREAS